MYREPNLRHTARAVAPAVLVVVALAMAGTGCFRYGTIDPPRGNHARGSLRSASGDRNAFSGTVQPDDNTTYAGFEPYGDDARGDAPADDAVVHAVAGDLHQRIVNARGNGALVLPDGAALTVELGYARDETGVDFDSYAGYLGQQVVSRMAGNLDAPYAIVATSADRARLLEAHHARTIDAYDEDSLTRLGDLLAGNLSLFVSIENLDAYTERLVVKLFVVHTATLLYGAEYDINSHYGYYRAGAERAAAQGDTAAAIDAYERAFACRRGCDACVADMLAELGVSGVSRQQPMWHDHDHAGHDDDHGHDNQIREPQANWEELGWTDVWLSSDEVIVDTWGHPRGVHHLRLSLDSGLMEVIELEIIYENGSRETVPVNLRLKEARPREIELGARSRVDHIHIRYRAASLGWAILTVAGR